VERKEVADPRKHWMLELGTKKHPVGRIPFTAHRPFELPDSIHLTLDAGRWYLSFSSQNDTLEPTDEETLAWLASLGEHKLTECTVGLDRGVIQPVAASDGSVYRFLPVEERRFRKKARATRRYQRAMARRKQGSRRRQRVKARVAALKRYGRDVRWNFAHQVSHRLTSDAAVSLLVLEDLKIRAMSRSAKGTAVSPGNNVQQKAALNRRILDSGWGRIKTYAQYKARRRGKLLITVPAQYSSQECSGCGHTHSDNRPSQARFVCLCCGLTLHADLNAARVIARRGVRAVLEGNVELKEPKRASIRKKVGVERPEPEAATSPTCVEIDISRCGTDRPVARRSRKREETPAAAAAA
jgi:putative transposase